MQADWPEGWHCGFANVPSASTRLPGTRRTDGVSSVGWLARVVRYYLGAN
jgi:hypothetical protein